MKWIFIVLFLIVGCTERDVYVEPTERIEEPIAAFLNITELNHEYQIEHVGSFFVEDSGYYINLKSISKKNYVKHENQVFRMNNGKFLETIIIIRKSPNPKQEVLDLTKYTFYLAVCDQSKCYDSFIKSKKYSDRTEFTYITPLPPGTEIRRIYTGFMSYPGGFLSSGPGTSTLIAEIDPRLVR